MAAARSDEMSPDTLAWLLATGGFVALLTTALACVGVITYLIWQDYR